MKKYKYLLGRNKINSKKFYYFYLGCGGAPVVAIKSYELYY